VENRREHPPGRFELVAANEKGFVAIDSIEDEAFICLRYPNVALCGGQRGEDSISRK